jgi:hypothetical protein
MLSLKKSLKTSMHHFFPQRNPVEADQNLKKSALFFLSNREERAIS